MLGLLEIPPVALGSSSRGADRLVFCSLVFARMGRCVLTQGSGAWWKICGISLPPRHKLDLTRSLIQIHNQRHDEASSLVPPGKGRGENKTTRAAGISIPFTLAEDGVGSWTEGQTSPLTSFSSPSWDGTQPLRVSLWPCWEARGQPITKTMVQHCQCPAYPRQAPCLPRGSLRPVPCPAPRASIRCTAPTAGTSQGAHREQGCSGAACPSLSLQCLSSSNIIKSNHPYLP